MGTMEANPPVVSALEQDAFADLFAVCYDDALRLALLLSGSRDRAEDAVGEAFAKVLRRWHRGGIADPQAYLRRAVVNEVHSSFRRLALQRRELLRRSGDGRGQRGSDEDLADTDQVLRALQRLPRRQRTAVVLRYYHDLSEQEIADVMGCAVGTVKSNTSRGLDRLRVLMGQGATR